MQRHYLISIDTEFGTVAYTSVYAPCKRAAMTLYLEKKQQNPGSVYEIPPNMVPEEGIEVLTHHLRVIK